MNRILDFFKTDERDQIRRQLVGTLQAVICQRMVNTISGSMTPALEILISNSTVRKLIEETKRRWPLKCLKVIHRLGVVPVGEASLYVRVEAAHRGEAFAAAQFIIDELKQTVPIWKRGVPA